ncbi:hypothetical protein IKG29_00045 [Candidatus Saccharibacteria bacterium]|nr:hypothetical protein [Candidatus Saccharibacteria bacterium]
MAKGTLPVWLIVLFLGGVMSALTGYFNVYVPKDQKNLAKRISKIGQDKLKPFELSYVHVKLRFDRMRYLLLSVGVATTSLITFFLEGYKDSCSELSGVIFWVICVIAYLVSILIIFSSVYAMEEAAFSDIERKYWRRYGVKVKWFSHEDNIR